MRGLTTQKAVSSTRWGLNSFSSSAVAMTWLRSSDKVTAVTWPISTSLNLILVLPASSPSALLKVMVITGPCSRMDFTASQPPMRAATMGTSQTSCRDHLDFGATSASGKADGSGRGGASGIVVLHGIPDQARVEAHRRKHRQYHHGAKGQCPGGRLDAGQRIELHQRCQHGDHIYVQHGPFAHQFHQAVELGQGHQDTGDEHHQGEGPGA